jgi:hypothetical protein
VGATFGVNISGTAQTTDIAVGAVSPIDFDDMGISSITAYQSEIKILEAVVDSDGYPIYVSVGIDVAGGYSARHGYIVVRMDGALQATKTISSAGDPDTIGNQWFANGAMVQHVIQSPADGTRTIEIFALGSDAVYGVGFTKGNLYVEAKKR